MLSQRRSGGPGLPDKIYMERPKTLIFVFILSIIVPNKVVHVSQSLILGVDLDQQLSLEALDKVISLETDERFPEGLFSGGCFSAILHDSEKGNGLILCAEGVFVPSVLSEICFSSMEVKKVVTRYTEEHVKNLMKDAGLSGSVRKRPIRGCGGARVSCNKLFLAIDRDEISDASNEDLLKIVKIILEKGDFQSGWKSICGVNIQLLCHMREESIHLMGQNLSWIKIQEWPEVESLYGVNVRMSSPLRGARDLLQSRYLLSNMGRVVTIKHDQLDHSGSSTRKTAMGA